MLKTVKRLVRKIRPARLRPRWNVLILGRDLDGFVTYEHRGHNIYLDTGRNWLLELMSYDVPGGGMITPGNAPPDTFHENRAAFVALGIGGREQDQQVMAGSIYTTYYPAKPQSWEQDDTDTSVTGLEMPIMRQAALYARPIISTVLTGSPSYTEVTYTATFDQNDFITPHQVPTPFPSIPLSEVVLLHSNLSSDPTPVVQEPDEAFVKTQALAYEAFPSIGKSIVVQLEVRWTLRV